MTNVNKKITLLICLVLSLVMMLVLSSCNSGETPSNDSTNTGETNTDTDNTTPDVPHVHTYGEFVTTKEPTCTELGEKTKACSCGDVVSEPIEATGHTEEALPAVEPTCASYGFTEGKKCSECNVTIVEQTRIPLSTNHDYSKITKVIQTPTFSQDGSATFECVVCAQSVDMTLPALSSKVMTKDDIYSIEVNNDENPASSNIWNMFDGNITSSGIYTSGNDWFGNVGDTIIVTFDQEIVLEELYVYLAGNGASSATVRVKNANGQTLICEAVKANASTDGGEGKKVQVFKGQNYRVYIIEVEIVVLNSDCKTFKLAEIEAWGAKQDTRVLSMDNNHIHHYRELVEQLTPSTCVQRGTATYACYCGKTADYYTPKLVREFTQTVSYTPATCTEDGKSVMLCTCGSYKKTETIPKLGHDYQKLVKYIKEPTQNEGGSAIYQCVRCDSTQEIELAPITIHIEEAISAVAPTCTEAGLTEGKKCSVCGEILVAQEVVPAKGHSYSEFVTTKEPICTEEGIKEKKCSCGDTVTEPIAPTGHTEETVPAIEPTCTKTGLTEGVKCSVCNEIIVAQEEIKATGHTEEIIPEVGFTCTMDGTTEGKKCSVCEEILLAPEKIDAHHIEETVSGCAPTCTEIGWKAGKKCTVCGEITLEQKEIIPYGHNIWYNFNSGACVCSVCGKKSSEGLIYRRVYSCNGYELRVSSIGDCTDTDIIIPSYYGGMPVTGIYSSAFEGCTSLKSITIPDSSHIYVDTSAFKGCTSLEIVTFQDYSPFECSSDADHIRGIDYEAFSGCTSLTSVTIPKSVTSIGSFAFKGCSSLTSVTIPKSVTSIGSFAFKGCSSLTSITVDENNSTYKSIDGNLYSKSGKTLIQYAIGKSATSFEIPNSVTSIENYAFYDCDSLTSITIPNSVTSIGKSAFYDCDSLTSITIPNSVTSIGESAFESCDSLTSITIPDSVTSIGESTFYNCSSLTSITIPDSVTSIGSSAFFGCDSLKSVDYLGTIEQWCNVSFGSSFANPLCNGAKLYLNGTLVTNLVIPSEVTSIGYDAFYGCTSLTSVTIPNSVTSIGSSAFRGCTSLSSITIPDSVTSIEYDAFRGCTSLTSITIPNSVTSIGSSAFYGCTSLTSITIYATSIGDYAFRGCTSLTSVTIGDSVTSIGEGAFYNCTRLTSVTIPNSVTSIGEGAFYKCTSLTSVTIGDSVTSIGSYAFYNCTSLTSVRFKNTTGWYVTTTEGATSGKNFSVLYSSTNATYLKTTYCSYYWYRK